MADLLLVCGNKNYSSWSLRPWLALRVAGIDFDEETIWLDTPTARAEKLGHSPAGRVPVLRHGALVVWDSLAICEYVAELFPDRGLWPSAVARRARARSLCAEMRAGFQALRQELPMNTRRRRRTQRPLSDAVHGDIARIEEIWSDAEGPFLFGEFGIADAFFAPVASRFLSYGIEVEGPAAAYQARLLDLEPVKQWFAAAEAETQRLPAVDSVP